ATQPGNVAQDGADGDSPYTKALAATMRTPGLDIFQTFNEVGLQVKRATGGSQQPWVASSPIEATFFFAAPQETATAVRPASPPAVSETEVIVRSVYPGWKYSDTAFNEVRVDVQ